MAFQNTFASYFIEVCSTLSTLVRYFDEEKPFLQNRHLLLETFSLIASNRLSKFYDPVSGMPVFYQEK